MKRMMIDVILVMVVFIPICLCFFLYLLNFEKRDTPQGCENIDGKCRGIIVDCSLMKNENMCERSLNYGKCFWNYSSEVCIDFKTIVKCDDGKTSQQCAKIQYVFKLVIYFLFHSVPNADL
jgi:hypothetical protein